jgi:hypothetical protein
MSGRSTDIPNGPPPRHRGFATLPQMGERTTEGRYGYWFPLALLGFGLLLLLGWESVRTPEDFGWFAYDPALSDTGYVITTAVAISPAPWRRQHRGAAACVFPGLGLDVDGADHRDAGKHGGLVRRAGSPGRPVRAASPGVAVGGGVAVWASHFVAGFADASADPGELIPSVGLPLVALGVLAGVWVYLRPGPGHRTAATISVCCLLVGVAVLLGAWSPGLLDPVFLACGLLALAWFERSRLVAVVACLVLVARFVFPDGTLSTLVPAVIVFAAGIVALVRRNNTAAPA